MFRSGRPASHLQEGRREERRTYITCCGSISPLSSAPIGSLRSYFPVGSGTSTESDQNGLWIAALTHTRHPYRTCSLCHLAYQGVGRLLPGLPHATYLQEVFHLLVGRPAIGGLWSTCRAKRRPRRDRRRGDIDVDGPRRSLSRILTARDTARARKQVSGSSASMGRSCRWS